MAKSRLTPGYIIFYLLFLPDTWQVIAGIMLAFLFIPSIATPEMGAAARAMLYLMGATIGYAVFRIPGKWISEALKRLILGDRRPGR